MMRERSMATATKKAYVYRQNQVFVRGDVAQDGRDYQTRAADIDNEYRKLLGEPPVYYPEFRRTVSYENQDEQRRHL